MDSTNYTHIRNTILNVSDILDPVFSILLSGRDICVIANTTDGNITIELAPYQWQQAATTTLVIDNVAGANNIDLVATLDTDPFNKAWALQDSLELTTVGASVILKLIRSGSGTATISVDGVPIIGATDNVGYVLVQATNVDYKQETNLIEQAGGSGGGGSYVTLNTNQTITGIKTFSGAPVISTITNTGTLTLPTTTDTLVGRITTDTLQNKSLVANNSLFIDSLDNTKRLIFTVSGNNAGVTTNLITNSTANRNITLPNNDGTLALTSDLSNYVDLTTNQTIGGIKTFTSKVAITALTNQIDLGASPNIITINSIAPTASRTYTIRDAGGNADFIMSTFGSTQTIAGGLTSSGLLTASNGLTQTTGALNLTSTSGSISLTGTNFTTNNKLAITATSSQIDLGASPNITTLSTSGAGNKTITFPATGGTLALFSDLSNYVDLTTNQTIGGIKTFTSKVAITALTNQIDLGASPNIVTINAVAPSSARTYTIPDVGSLTASFIMSTFGSTQTIAGGLTSSGLLTASNGLTQTTGALNLTSTSGAISLTNTTFTTNNALNITPTTNQLVLGITNTTTINSIAPTASRTYTIRDAGGNADFIMSTFGSTQTIAGGLTSSGLLTASNGLTQTTGALNLTSTSGAISLTGTTFTTNNPLNITATSNQFALGASPNITTLTTSGTGNKTITFPATGGTLALFSDLSNYVDLTTNQTIGGIKTFTSKVAITALTNQIDLGASPNIVTINAIAPSDSRTYTIPDVGSSTASFIMSTFGSTQTIAGGLTSSGLLTASNGLTQTTGALNLTSTSGAISLTNTTFTTNNALNITPTTNQLVLGITNTTTISSIAPTASRTYTIRDAGGNADFILSNSGSGQTITGGLTSSGLLSLTGVGTTTTGNFYNIPSVVNNPTASSYYWSYFASPPAFTGSSVTIPNAYTVYIAGAPNAGTSTITNPYAFYVASGKTYIGGNLQIPTGAVNNYVLTSDASGNASWSAAGSVVSFPDGTLALPGIYFTNEPGTGFYRPGNGQIGVELSGNNYATFTTTGFTSTQPITITPTANQLILGTGTTTTLSATATTSNKTLTLPDATDTLVGLTTSDTLQNKRLIANNCSFRDSTDNTKQLNFTLSGNSSGVITTIASTLTANRTYTIRDAGADADFILSTFGSTQTIAGGLTSSGLLTASNGLTQTTGALNLTSTSGTVSLGGTTSLTASNKVSITALTNQIDLGASPNITTITSPAPSGSRTYTIPDVGSSTASFIMSTSGSTQTIAGGLTSSGLLTASNGLTQTTGALNLTSTSGTVSLTGTTFTTNNPLNITATSAQLGLGTGSNITTLTTSGTGNKTLTLPSIEDTIVGRITTDTLQNKSLVATNCSFIDSVDSTKQLNFTVSSNSTGVTSTIRSFSTVNRTFDLPNNSGTIALVSDIPTNANYVDLTTNQTVAGNKTFTGRTSVSGLVHTVNSALTGNTVLTSTGYTSVIPLNSTSAFTVTLPSTSGNDGLNFRFINVNSGAVTIQTSTSSECFDGNASITSLSLLQFDRVNILCYNGFWFTF